MHALITCEVAFLAKVEGCKVPGGIVKVCEPPAHRLMHVDFPPHASVQLQCHRAAQHLDADLKGTAAIVWHHKP